MYIYDLFSKSYGLNYFGRANHRRLFTGANPLLLNTGTFVCCVSALDRFAPP